jgi:integrase
MNMYIEKIKKRVRNSNDSKKIKIRLKKTRKEIFSIYLDYWHNNKREYVFLKKYIKGSKDSTKTDNEILRYAIAYRDTLEIDLLREDTGFTLQSESNKANFVEYFKKLSETKEGGSRKKWISLYKHLVLFTKGKVQINNIDTKFCKEFYLYLNNIGSYSTPRVYFKVFKAALNKLVYDGIIPVNPAKNLTQDPDIKRKLRNNKEQLREYLTVDELKELVKTPANNIQTRNAFLFSCFTGLRLGDIEALTFKQISNGFLTFNQHKTDESQRLKLHPQALQILKQQKKNSRNNKLIFHLYDNKAVNKHIKKWVEEANIDKKISFHCARHTFATMCLTNDIDIFTVSKLLGHKDLESTQIYAKLIDKKKDEAIDKLPEF